MATKTLQSIAPRLPAGLLYGGDYNPEQWPEEIWVEDMALMRRAGVNLVSLGIFSWAKLEPQRDCYDFGWLDRIVALLAQNGIAICLATATASPPPWLSIAHPESLPVNLDGVRFSPGSRQHYCPNSTAYRERGAQLIRAIAQRYAAHAAVALWHVNNEIGCHSFECYCDVCAGEFRQWLARRYGTIERLNEAWGTTFWSQQYQQWTEILPPRRMLTFRNPGQVLDYSRFMSDSLTAILEEEVRAIRAVDPAARVTTNGLPFPRPLDYFRFYRAVDIVAWDSYPDPAGGLDEIGFNAFNHDLFRGLGANKPFILMEQAATQVNWRPLNFLKPPGQMRALSYSALARGADGVMFFQWRASRAGAEKFHSGMVPHYGVEGSRVFQEIETLGGELKQLAPLAGTGIKARVAFLVSWENRWALELESKPKAFDYARIVRDVYLSLWEMNIAVDVVHPDASLDSYDVVIAPALYQVTARQSDRLRAFVARGGALVMTYFSGVVDESERVWLGGYLGGLGDVFGAVVEEWQPLDQPGGWLLKTKSGAKVSCRDFCDLLHARGAEVLAQYADSFFAGRPAVTRNRVGSGQAVYIGTGLEREHLQEVLGEVFSETKIRPPIQAARGVEVSVRGGETAEFLFVINHTADTCEVAYGEWSGQDLLTGKHCAGETTIEPLGVRIIHRVRLSPESSST